MASMFTVKNIILRATKASFVPQPPPSIYAHKVSRVCFTSSSKYNQNQYARENAGGDEDAKAAERIREARKVYESDEEAEEVERQYNNMKQKANDTMQGMKDKAKEGTQQASEAMQEAKDRAMHQANRAGDTMYEAKEAMKDKAKEGTDRAGDTMHNAKERTKDTMEWTADKTKEGAGKAADAMQSAGEKVKETVKGAWEKAKDTTQKMKETVVGKDDDDYKNVEDYMDDHRVPKYGDARDLAKDLPRRPKDAADQDIRR